VKWWNSRGWGAILWPLTLPYLVGVNLRKRLYSHIFYSHCLNAKVISVGNITVGGTGKTPLVEKIAKMLQADGHRVAVLSRGYGRMGKGVIVVSNGKEVRGKWEETGDEPFLLARRLPGIPVVVGKNRVEAGRLAVQQWGCGVLLLDDGFQHMKVKRDLDLITMDAENPWGNKRLLPAGPLREPLSSVKRADAVILTQAHETRSAEKIKTKLHTYTSAPVFTAIHRPVEWVSLKDKMTFPVRFLRRKKVLAFAGIGNPQSFYTTLETLELDVFRFFIYKDHHNYSKKDRRRIFQEAGNRGVQAVVTTEKDAVRFPDVPESKIPVYYLRIEIEIEQGIQELKAMLNSIFQSSE